MTDPIGLVTGPGLNLSRWGFLRLTPHWRAARTLKRHLRQQKMTANVGQLRRALRESGLLQALQGGSDTALTHAADHLDRVDLWAGEDVTHDGELLVRLGRLAYTRTSDLNSGLTMLAASLDRTGRGETGGAVSSLESILEAYSLPLREGIVELRATHGETAVRIARELSGSHRVPILRDWNISPPPWLPHDARLATWLAELAHASSSTDGAMAAEWFGRAIELGGSPRGYLKLRRFYAHGDQNDTRFRAELADVLDDPLVQAVGPTDEPDKRLHSLDAWRPATAYQHAFRSMLRTQFLAAQGEYDLAIAEGRAAFEDHGHLGAGLNATDALLRRSYTEPRRTHGSDVALALQIASVIRAQQIRWGLDSGRALALSVRAQMALANTDAAWALVSPDSEATDTERAHQEVRELQVLLLVEFGRLDEARELIDETFPRRLRLQVDARKAELSFDTETSTRLWAEVVDETEDLTEKASLCLRLAMQGQLHPWVAELRDLNADLASEVELIAELYNGSPSAEQRARLLIQDSMRVAHALIAWYMDRSRTTEVAHFAERAAEKWNIADDWLRAAIGRIQLGELSKAAALAARALAAGGANWGDRERAHRILIEVAYQSRDWVEAALAAEGLLADIPDHDDARWALIGAHFHAGEPEAAFNSLSAHPIPLKPRRPAEAAMWLEVFKSYGTDMAPVSDAVDVIQSFSNDPSIRAAAVSSLALAPIREIPEGFSADTVLSDLQASYPDDPGFEILTDLDTDNPEELLDLLDQAMGPHPDTSELDEGLARGTLPIGAASRFWGKTYTEVLVRNRQGPRFIGSLQGVDEMSAARRALIEAPVVDATALTTLALLGADYSALILPALPSLRTPVAQLLDARQAQQTMSRSSEATFVPSNGARSRTFVFRDAATIERDAEVLDALLGLLRQSERADVPNELPEELHRLRQLDGAWTSALLLARVTGAPFWCDDAATRRLAVELNLHAFGTPMLIAAIAETGQMGEAGAAISAMLVHDYAIGVPFDATTYALALDLDSWQPLGTARALRHSGASHLPEKIDLLNAALDRAAKDSQPEALQGWSQILGEFVTDLDVGERREGNQVHITQTLLSQPWQSASTFPFVARGLRTAFGDGWPQALSSAVRQRRHDLARNYGHPVASSYLLGLVQGLPDDDRRSAVGVILEP